MDSPKLIFLLLIAGTLTAATAVTAQQIPPGTALPVMLNSTLDANKDKPGEKIEGKIMQDVPLGPGAQIGYDSHVTGHIVSVRRRSGSSGSSLTLQFDQIEDHGTVFTLTAAVRAMAGMEAIFQAQQPINSDSSSVSSDQWTTVQVGGDHVQRSQLRVVTPDQIVGKTTSGGAVTAKLTAAAKGACPATDGDDREQALWLFSTSACGLYGFSNLKLTHAGRTAPVGQIELQSSKDLLVRGGSGWLLLVQPASGTPAAKP